MCVCVYNAAAKSLQLCPTLCDPIDSSPLGSSVPGILQAKILKWVAISFSNAGKWKVKVKSCSRVQLFATPWTAAYQAPPSMGFSRQEYWSGVPLTAWQVHLTPLSNSPHRSTGPCCFLSGGPGLHLPKYVQFNHLLKYHSRTKEILKSKKYGS